MYYILHRLSRQVKKVFSGARLPFHPFPDLLQPFPYFYQGFSKLYSDLDYFIGNNAGIIVMLCVYSVIFIRGDHEQTDNHTCN